MLLLLLLQNLNAGEYDWDKKKRKCSLLRQEMGYSYDADGNEAADDEETGDLG